MHRIPILCHHQSLFSTKAPPISAPGVPMLTLAIPQSLPPADKTTRLPWGWWSWWPMISPEDTSFCMQNGIGNATLVFDEIQDGCKGFCLYDGHIISGLNNRRSHIMAVGATHTFSTPPFTNNLPPSFFWPYPGAARWIQSTAWASMERTYVVACIQRVANLYLFVCGWPIGSRPCPYTSACTINLRVDVHLCPAITHSAENRCW